MTMSGILPCAMQDASTVGINREGSHLPKVRLGGRKKEQSETDAELAITIEPSTQFDDLHLRFSEGAKFLIHMA
jgi:hypothetical protein